MTDNSDKLKTQPDDVNTTYSFPVLPVSLNASGYLGMKASKNTDMLLFEPSAYTSPVTRGVTQDNGITYTVKQVMKNAVHGGLTKEITYTQEDIEKAMTIDQADVDDLFNYIAQRAEDDLGQEAAHMLALLPTLVTSSLCHYDEGRNLIAVPVAELQNILGISHVTTAYKTITERMEKLSRWRIPVNGTTIGPVGYWHFKEGMLVVEMPKTLLRDFFNIWNDHPDRENPFTYHPTLLWASNYKYHKVAKTMMAYLYRQQPRANRYYKDKNGEKLGFRTLMSSMLDRLSGLIPSVDEVKKKYNFKYKEKIIKPVIRELEYIEKESDGVRITLEHKGKVISYREAEKLKIEQFQLVKFYFLDHNLVNLLKEGKKYVFENLTKEE